MRVYAYRISISDDHRKQKKKNEFKQRFHNVY